MLAKVTIGDGEWFKYKSETALPAGDYFWFMGRKPSDELKKKLCLIAASRGRDFKWLAPYEPWVKRFVDGLLDLMPSLHRQPRWELLGIDPDRLRGWQKRQAIEMWNYLASRFPYRKGWIAPLGAGKTLGGLTASQFYEPGETAVLASRYLHETWRSEAKEWGIAPPIISTYESCHKLPKGIKCLIVDEAIVFKNSDAQRTVSAVALSKQCETVIGYTGIPIGGGNAPDWRWLRVVSPGCVPADVKAWQFAWGLDTQLKEVGPNKAYVTENYNHEEISRFISPFIHTVDISEIASEMPEVTEQFIVCPTPPDYKSIQAGAGTTRGTHKRLAQALQCTDGFIYNDEEQAVRIVAPKIAAVKEWVESLAEPVLLVGAWSETVDILAEIFKEKMPSIIGGSSSSDPSREIERFKSGMTSIMIANAGYSKGMNLQKVCRIAGFLSVSSKPDDLKQMKGRLARPRQKDGVQFVFFVCDETLDRRRIELVQKHQDRSEDFVDKLLLEELNK